MEEKVYLKENERLAEEKVYKIGIVVSILDEEYQTKIVKGIQEYAKNAKEYINLACFVSFGGVISDAEHDIGEYAIYDLINYKEFDGLILLTNTIQAQFIAEEITRKAKKHSVPIVSIDYNLGKGTYFIGIDNYKAMYEMIEHLIVEHDCKTINFVSGANANVDSVARLNAYVDCLTKHGIQIENERVYEGFFRRQDGKSAVEHFIENRDKTPMPEAIVFANDAMALSGTSTLMHNGYRVPEDVKVIGFDHIYEAKNFAPSISSVKRPLKKAGYKALEIIMQHNLNKEPEQATILETQAVFIDSCGCTNNTIEDACKEPLETKKYIAELKDSITRYKRSAYDLFDVYRTNIPLNNRMSVNMIEKNDFEATLESLKNYVQEVGCEKFYLCLCDDWITRSKDRKKTSRLANKLTDNLIIPLSYRDGLFRRIKEIKSSTMLPDLYKRGDKGDMYIFSPVHYQNKTFGYTVLCNSEFAISNPLYHSWVMNISTALENLRKIESIESISRMYQRLYVSDSLTGIYNRNGFYEFTKDPLLECAEKKVPIMILFSDMDGLKYINDTYGHPEGDKAIKAFANALKATCGKREVCARLGGDEFVVFAENYTESMAEDFKNRLEQKLDEHNRKCCDCCYKIEASVGWFIEVPKVGVSVFTIASHADQIMYEVKRKRKESKYLRKVNT